MPIHDWSKVEATLFHHFHQFWIADICRRLNEGLLPQGFSALVQQNAGGLIPDVLALQRRSSRSDLVGGTLLAEAPATSFVYETEDTRLAGRGNRVAFRHRLGEVVCVIEIVSPGNKSSGAALRGFVNKAVDLLESGVHLLIADLFPPSVRDPGGIHGAIWEELNGAPFELPSEKIGTLVAYVAGDPVAGRMTRAYVEPIAVGQLLPDMPAFLDERHHVPVPLEAAYQSAWKMCPADLRTLVETGRLPGE